MVHENVDQRLPVDRHRSAGASDAIMALMHLFTVIATDVWVQDHDDTE